MRKLLLLLILLPAIAYGANDLAEYNAKQVMQNYTMTQYEAQQFSNLVLKGVYGIASEANPISLLGLSDEEGLIGQIIDLEDQLLASVQNVCENPEAIADSVIASVNKNFGGFRPICEKLADVDSCINVSDYYCSMIGAPIVYEGADMNLKVNIDSVACPPNRQAIQEACEINSVAFKQLQINASDIVCKTILYDELGKGIVDACERYNSESCDKESYMARCLAGVPPNLKANCPVARQPDCGEGMHLTFYKGWDGCVSYSCQPYWLSGKQKPGNLSFAICEAFWTEQVKACEWVDQYCNKENWNEICLEEARKGLQNVEPIDDCDTASINLKVSQQNSRCDIAAMNRAQCKLSTSAWCMEMRGVGSSCLARLNEEAIRNDILFKINSRCYMANSIPVLRQFTNVSNPNAQVLLSVDSAVGVDDLNRIKSIVTGLTEIARVNGTIIFSGKMNSLRYTDLFFLPYVNEVKILAVDYNPTPRDTEELAKILASLGESGIPLSYTYVLDQNAVAVINVSGTIKEIEEVEDSRGFFYDFFKFLGLAQSTEMQDIEKLKAERLKLQEAIDQLNAVIDTVPSEIAKEVIRTQVSFLIDQQVRLDLVIAEKESNAKGVLGIFG